MPKTYISYTCTFLLGAVFLFSSFAKAWDGDAFAKIILQYGPQWFSIIAPLIIAIEATLAIALLLRIYTKWTLIATIVFVVGVSLVYLYGLIFRHITDCGCFGSFHILNSSYWVTFVRNVIFIAIAILGIYVVPSMPTYPPRLWQYVVSGLTVCSATFICGLSMSRSFELPTHLSLSPTSHHTALVDTSLPAYFSFDNDSTYVVYLFSFTCAHCQNGFANLEQYASLHVADKVYGLAVADSVAEIRFRRIYRPSIPIYSISSGEMTRLTHELPVLLFIRNGVIYNKEVGSVTSPGIFIE